MKGIKQVLGVVIGIVVGLVGGTLFKSTLPPEKGSTADKIEEQRHELKSARNRLAVLEAERRRGDERASQAARNIAADIRAGRDVDVNEVFNLTKPWLSDIAPLLERMRVKAEKEMAEGIAGEMARKYDLTKIQQARLEDWLAAESKVNAEKYRAVLEDEESDFEDFIRASEDFDDFTNLDDFMEKELQGEKLAEYQKERLFERSENVTGEANRQLHRLHEVVDLDVAQQDAAFLLLARGSSDYEQGMEVDGMPGAQGGLSQEERNREVLALLRPDQQQSYEAFKEEQRLEMQEEMSEMGMTLPTDWNFFDDDLLN